MSRRVFWPGFNWRVLAHERIKAGRARDVSYTGRVFDKRCGDRWLPPRDAAPVGQREHISGVWEFDELAIDDWFHLEQMGDRDWWIGVGNGDDYWHVNVHIDRDGRASVSMEKQ